MVTATTEATLAAAMVNPAAQRTPVSAAAEAFHNPWRLSAGSLVQRVPRRLWSTVPSKL